ncbi:hypothetical protein PoB_003206600 [Plakobranchus ocellatus]|uniref:Homeobox domain-containing protein n=1 Tax=Plakobranchus ocellatus TaxID=259542 RepID=A0AAV4A2U2_9GAST|nr:hypothetical protein PoB_003206600 [Plakobranchus ocellatus]
MEMSPKRKLGRPMGVARINENNQPGSALLLRADMRSGTGVIHHFRSKTIIMNEYLLSWAYEVSQTPIETSEIRKIANVSIHDIRDWVFRHTVRLQHGDLRLPDPHQARSCVAGHLKLDPELEDPRAGTMITQPPMPQRH